MVEIDKRKISFLRGIAIFLVLWGHSVQYCCNGNFDFFENNVFKTIYSFHMPFFMLISGYLFGFSSRRRDFRELLAHKSEIIRPILMGTVLTFILTKGVVYILTGNLSDLFNGNALKEYDSIWFLWSVFAASVALSIAIKTSNNKCIKICLVIMGFIVVALFPNAKMNIYLYPYYVIGFIYFCKQDRLKVTYNIAKIISIIIFPLMLMFYENKHYIYLRGGTGIV